MQEQDVREKVRNIDNFLSSQFFEREDEVTQVLAACFIKENFFLLGPPGTAKSEFIGVLFGDCFEGRYSYHLLTKSLPPDQVLGPIDLQKFKEENKEEHNTEGYLPDAHWGGLDEAWKSNDTLLNNLLTILNEGIFRNGRQVEQCPMRSACAMSNELPQQDILEALYDRFLLRLTFDPVNNQDNFRKILESDRENISPPEKLTLDELDYIEECIEDIKVSDRTISEFFNLREDINSISDDLYVSDRRFKQAFKFMKAMAWINGFDSVTKDDFTYIENCLWSKPQQRRDIQSVLMNYFSSAVSRAHKTYNEITANIETALESNDSSQIANIYAEVSDKKDDFDEYIEQQKGTDHYRRLKDISDKLEKKFKQIKSYYREECL